MHKLIFIYHPIRSGGHAIANWIVRHEYNHDIDDSKIFINNINEHSPNIPIKTLKSKLENRKLTSKLVIIGHENYIPIKDNLTYGCKISKCFPLFILRDAYNWLASLLVITDKRKIKQEMENSINAWVYYATNFFSDKNFIAIKYNEWFTKKSYRKEISKRLSLNWTDEGLNHVSKIGGGSSFDACKYNNRAQEMNVLNRYCQSSTEIKIRIDKILSENPKLYELNQKLFNNL